VAPPPLWKPRGAPWPAPHPEPLQNLPFGRAPPGAAGGAGAKALPNMPLIDHRRRCLELTGGRVPPSPHGRRSAACPAGPPRARGSRLGVRSVGPTPHGYNHHRWLRAPPAKSPTRASSFRRARGLTAGGRRVRGVRAMGASRGGEEVASWPRRRTRASQSASALAMISPISPPASSAAAVALHDPSARHRIWPSQVQESHIQ
jgi:hypothetical protein